MIACYTVSSMETEIMYTFAQFYEFNTVPESSTNMFVG